MDGYWIRYFSLRVKPGVMKLNMNTYDLYPSATHLILQSQELCEYRIMLAFRKLFQYNHLSVGYICTLCALTWTSRVFPKPTDTRIIKLSSKTFITVWLISKPLHQNLKWFFYFFHVQGSNHGLKSLLRANLKLNIKKSKKTEKREK